MIVLRDKREKKPWLFDGLDVQITDTTLTTGDYQLFHQSPRLAVVERKSIQDLVSTLELRHGRFLAECGRMCGFRFRWIVVEGSVSDVMARNYRGKISPETAVSRLSEIESRYRIGIEWGVGIKMAQRVAYELFRWAEVVGG